MKWIKNYASRYLALWAQGHLGFFGFGKETTWGTAVAATDYAEIMSENLSLSIDRFPTRNVFSGFYEPDDFDGLRRVAGSVSLFGHPVSIGHFLKAAMNTISGSVVQSGTLWTSKFSSVKSEFADGVPSQPYTLEVYRQVNSADGTLSSFRYVGAVCNQLALSLAPNQDLRVSADWIAKGASIIARSTPTFPGSPIHPFAFDTASLSLGGSATARWESFNLTVNNAINPIPTLNHSNEIARMRRGDLQTVKISGVLDFVDYAEYLDFVNQTERQLRLNVFRSQSFNLLIDAPRFIYTTFPVGIPGRDRLTVGFDGLARYSQSSGVAIDFGLTTIKSNY